MLDFGSIFRYKEDYYVYLVETGDLTFAARIIDKENTKQLVRHRDLKSRASSNHTEAQPLYCFVVLGTDDFKDMCAHYGRPEISNLDAIEIVSHLNEKDLENLKREIKQDEATNIALRKAISDLFPE